MKSLITVVALLLLSSALVKAQDVKKTVTQPDSLIKLIPAGEGRHSFYLYTIGGKLQTREDVIIRLMAYAPAAQEYHAARNSATWAYVSFGAAGVSALAATLEYANNNRLAGATTGFANGEPVIIYQHHSLTDAYVLTGLATGFFDLVVY